MISNTGIIHDTANKIWQLPGKAAIVLNCSSWHNLQNPIWFDLPGSELLIVQAVLSPVTKEAWMFKADHFHNDKA